RPCPYRHRGPDRPQLHRALPVLPLAVAAGRRHLGLDQVQAAPLPPVAPCSAAGQDLGADIARFAAQRCMGRGETAEWVADLLGGDGIRPADRGQVACYRTVWNSIRYPSVSSSMGPAWAARRRRASRSVSPARRTSSSSITEKGTSSIESTSIQPGPTG